VAASKAGLPVVYLNTGFGEPQLNAVLEREGVDGIVADADLAGLVDTGCFVGPIVTTGGEVSGLATLEAVREGGPVILRF